MTGGAPQTVLPLPQTGRRVLVRDLTAADLSALRRAFVSADPAALQARFAGAAPKFDTLARRVKALDGHEKHAVAAFSDDGAVVGVAEYHVTGAGCAEVAVIVASTWQHEGVGTALLQRLGARAMSEGVTTATALLSGSNSQVLDLVHDIPMAHSITYDHGVGELCVHLTGGGDRLTDSPAAKD